MSSAVALTVATVKTEGHRLARSSIRLANSAWLHFSSSRAAVYIFFAAVYLTSNIALARRKLIWKDEFDTLYFSTTRNWHILWSALSTGADQTPPSFFYLTHLILRGAGAGPVTLRIPALTGFGLCCLCLFEIARRMVGREWAVVAMLLPLATPALYYATEARSYGLELGLTTFALLMWLLASAGERRPWTVLGLAVGLCLAVASHYYVALFVGALAIAEFVRTLHRRSIDFAIWCAFVAAAIPLFIFAPLILKARTYSGHFWAVPYWSAMAQWYHEMLGMLPLVLIAAAALVFVFRNRVEEELSPKSRPVPPAAIAALFATAVIPVIGMVIAKFVTHAYTSRYFIPALPSVLIFFLWALRRVLRNLAIGPLVACLLCLGVAGLQWFTQRAAETGAAFGLRSDVMALRRIPAGPIIISMSDTFYQLSFYAPRDVAARLVYLADPHLSVRYLGQDTVDRDLLEFAPWFPLHVAWWGDWWREHQTGLIYGPMGDWAWLTYALPAIGRTQMIERDGGNLLLSVTRNRVPDGGRVSGDPSGAPQMFEQIPQTGPSLCSLYMPGGCPALDLP